MANVKRQVTTRKPASSEATATSNAEPINNGAMPLMGTGTAGANYSGNYNQTGSYFGSTLEYQDNLVRNSGRGGISTAISSSLYGFNHQQMGIQLTKNKEQYGYVFFTRPRLRLSYDNLKMNRVFKLLDNKDDYSVYRWVRAVLDPKHRNGRVASPLVDDKNAFIPLLSNALVNLSGWPEITVDTYSSSEGLRKEQWAMADGFAKHYGLFNINCEFENMVNNYIPELFWYWTQYEMLVHEGLFAPHMESILENEIDYQTRIYRLVMDQTRTFVIDIAATGIAFPTSPAQAGRYDWNRDEVFNKANDSIQIPFQCMGACYKDPILMSEFNMTVQAFNLGMNDNVRPKLYKLLSPNEALLYNHFGYPRINLDTGRLEWWVENSDYAAIRKSQGY